MSNLATGAITRGEPMERTKRALVEVGVSILRAIEAAREDRYDANEQERDALVDVLLLLGGADSSIQEAAAVVWSSAEASS